MRCAWFRVSSSVRRAASWDWRVRWVFWREVRIGSVWVCLGVRERERGVETAGEVGDGDGCWLVGGFGVEVVVEGAEDGGVPCDDGSGLRRGDLNGLERVDAADSRRRRFAGGSRGIVAIDGDE